MSPARQARIWLIAFLVFGALLYLLQDVLFPFVAAAAVAYFLDPVADRLERAGMSRSGATIVITTIFVLLVVFLLLLIVPVLQGQIADFISKAPDYFRQLLARAQPLIEELSVRLGPERMEQLRQSAEENAFMVVGWAGDILGEVVSGGVALFNLLSLLFITPVVAFYLLRDWDLIVASVDRWLPRAQAPVIRAGCREIDETLSAFVRGQATVCIILGTFYAAALTAAGLDLGLLVGLTSGLVSFIPYVGSIAGLIVSVGLAIAQSSDWGYWILIAAIFIVGHAVEGNYLTPKLVGTRVGLHEVWVMFALLAGGAIMGFLGLLLAVPVAAVIGVLTRYFLSQYLASGLYTGDWDRAPPLAPSAQAAPPPEIEPATPEPGAPPPP